MSFYLALRVPLPVLPKIGPNLLAPTDKIRTTQRRAEGQKADTRPEEKQSETRC